MERLTKRLDDGQAVMDCESCELREQNCGPLACRNRLRYRLAAYENLGPVDHLRELVQAEQDGRLVVLPCNETDPV